MFVRIFREPFGIHGEDASWPTQLQTAVGVAAFAAGCVALARRERAKAALLALPFAFAVLAAVAGLYPLGAAYPTAGRVLMFLLPPLVLLVARGVAGVARAPVQPLGRRFAGVAAIALLLPSVLYATRAVPQTRAEIRPLLEYAAQNRQPGDLLYVHYRALPAFRYYAARTGWQGGAVVDGICARLRPAAYLDQLATLRGHPRVWVLLVDGKENAGYDERELITHYLEHAGARRDGVVASGAWLYLYDLRPQFAHPGDFSPVPPPRRARGAADECRGPWAAE
jgi:hypothetical protein